MNTNKSAICIGPPLISILAKEGQWVGSDGHGVVAADGLFRQDPYEKISQLERELNEAKAQATDFLKQWVESSAREVQLREALSDASSAISTRIEGKLVHTYLREQFPATDGHIPLNEYFKLLGSAIANIAGALTLPAPPVVPQTWQPISTAPTDNKRLLYLATLDENGSLLSLDFDGILESDQESWEIPSVYYYWASANGIEEPTHWCYQDLPLPKTPPPVVPAEDVKPLVEALKALQWAAQDDESGGNYATTAISTFTTKYPHLC